MNYYFDLLNAQEQEAYQILLKGIRKLKTEVFVPYNMSPKSMERIFKALRMEHTGLFYVNYRNHMYTYRGDGTNFRIGYDGDPESIKNERLWLRNTLKQFGEEMNAENLTDQRAMLRWIHHKLVHNTQYDHEAAEEPETHPRAFNILGVFQDHKAVCQGIAFAFKLLCDYFEIPCMIATGKASLENIGSNMLHAWNIICLDGKYAHVDITWDIGVSELSKFYRYDYFCIPDEWIKEDHIFEGYPKCEGNISYFESKNRVFTDYRSLAAYLAEEVKKKSDYLYFKMAVPGNAEEITKKTDMEVADAIAKNSFLPMQVSRIAGGMQMCFFYRLKTPELPGSSILKKIFEK